MVRFGSNSCDGHVVSFAWCTPNQRRTLLVVGLSDHQHLELCEVSWVNQRVCISRMSLATTTQYLTVAVSYECLSNSHVLKRM